MFKKIISISFICSIGLNAFAGIDAVNRNVMEQQKGNYPNMDRRESTPLGAIQKAFDKNKGAVYDIDHNPSEVIKIRMRESLDTSIDLPRWEDIKHVVTGNEQFIKAIKTKSNQVLLKPIEIGVDTSVTIVGLNTYRLYVRVEGYNSKNIPDIGVNIHAIPPSGMINNKSDKQQQDAVTDWLTQPVPTSPAGMDFEWSMAGDRDIAPELVYSDGTRTWLYYGEQLDKRNLPVVFMVEDGIDIPVNNKVIGKSIVVSGAGTLTLKNGVKTTCVYPTKLGRRIHAKKK